MALLGWSKSQEKNQSKARTESLSTNKIKAMVRVRQLQAPLLGQTT